MEFVLLVFGAYRVTRLLNRDDVTKPLQRRVPSRLAAGWFCPWCLGFWVSLVMVLAFYRAVSVGVAVEVFAVSAGVGLVTQTENALEGSTKLVKRVLASWEQP